MSADTLNDLLRPIPEPERDRLFELLKHGPAVAEELLGKRLHRSAFHRFASRGVAGVRLETVLVGGSRFTTRRLLLRFFVASAEAKLDACNSTQPSTSAEEEAALARHGMGRPAKAARTRPTRLKGGRHGKA